MKATLEELMMVVSYQPSEGVPELKGDCMTNDQIVDFAKQYHAKQPREVLYVGQTNSVDGVIDNSPLQPNKKNKMSELKFKAYDKITHTEVTEPMCYYMSFDDDGSVNIMNNIVVCQSIRKKDKNGVDIFNGDILDLGQTVNGCNIFIVVWSELGWTVQYGVEMNHPRLYEYNIKEFFKVDENTNEGIEVIGNIHETS